MLLIGNEGARLSDELLKLATHEDHHPDAGKDGVAECGSSHGDLFVRSGAAAASAMIRFFLRLWEV